MTTNEPTDDPSDFLRVDAFLGDVVSARALKTALEIGVVDQLLRHGASTVEVLLRAGCRGDARGMGLLLELLEAGRVVERRGAEVRLAPGFLAALRYRDLLEAKLEFALLVAVDFVDRFTALIAEPGRFMRESRLLELFGYQRCFEDTPENRQATRRWVRYTTALTRYEARPCLRAHDFGRYGRMLDVGGNSGEFALQLCKAHPALRATVFDLPVVCEVGREHVGREPEADRISFQKGNALADPLPGGFDLVTFKSMLHDWPEREAAELLARAARALRPGGTLLIFERGPVPMGASPLPFGMVPMLLFFRSFRGPRFYEERLRALGLEAVETRAIGVEMPFFLTTARRGGEPEAGAQGKERSPSS